MTTTPTPRDNPYVGPRAFRRAETLYGRDREARRLLSLLIAERIVLLYSPSGAGKTSLVQAMLIPVLERERFTVRNVMRVSRTPPPDAIRGIKVRNRYILSALLSLDTALEAAPAWDEQTPLERLVGMTLPEYLQEHPVTAESDDEVLIFDQFEEILTLDPTDRDVKLEFFAQVGAALRDTRRWALFSMREDYVASLDPYLRPIPTQIEARFRLDLLQVDAARQAIQKPAAAAGLAFTDAAAQKLVDDLRQMRVQQLDGSMRSKPGPYVEPVHLQLVCHQLWEKHRRANATEITEADVEALVSAQAEGAAMGSVDSALAGYYAERVAAVAAETGVPERVIREWFGNKLITPHGLRGQVMQDIRQTAGLDNEALRCLENAYLVRVERRRGVSWCELTHDRLIEPIRKNNAAWGENSLQQWQKQALQWNNQPATQALLKDRSLDEAERWVREHPDEVTEAERKYVDVSRIAWNEAVWQQAREAEQRTNLAKLGWGVIFAQDADPAIREALSELLDHRRRAATAEHESYYKEFVGEAGYRPDETAQGFLSRHRAGLGRVKPECVPYYLLVVGSPESISFEFQYGLDISYAVGRLHFATPGEYASYARSVVTVERGTFSLPRNVVLFGPRHKFDIATQMTVDRLVVPLAEKLRTLSSDWAVETVIRDDATKARLRELLGGRTTPTFLFTATHGPGVPPQPARIGSLLCQDWPGSGDPAPDHYLAAEDIDDDACLLGLIAFLFGSFTAGTPQMDDFEFRANNRSHLAPKALVAHLSQRLLGHPKGGALAVIGHVNRIFTYAFMPGRGSGTDTGLFEITLTRLLQGHTVGSAMELFNQRFAQLSFEVAEELKQSFFYGKQHKESELSNLMNRSIDARNYILLGDPAVRLPVSSGPEVDERPIIDPVVVASPGAVTVDETSPSTGDLTGDVVYVNGINGATGEYLLPPLAIAALAAVAKAQDTEGSRRLDEIVRRQSHPEL